MNIVDLLSFCLLLAGCLFFLAGTVGMLRFPDAYCRLHALSKADNLGLFFLCAGLGLYGGEWRAGLLLAVIWVLNLLAATTSAHLIARHAHRVEGLQAPERKDARDDRT
ncbi:MAG: monovalent cation/H(+) antiporter subunit G [Wenzhouxiangellaceae bacterium]|nr:monovalent cation/H(+) antiporter subunit G [Wenzhouxiangellaceae bacterium]